MENRISLPVYIRLSQIVLGIVAFFYVMYVGQDIILPLTFSLIIAILLNPFVNYLQRKGCNRVAAIFIAVFLAFLVTVGLLYLIGSQVSMFTDSLPQLKQKLNVIFKDSIGWVSHHFNVSTAKINEWITKQKSDGMSNSSAMIGQTLTTITNVLVIVFLLPVYIFMLLFYKPLLLDFIARLFPTDRHKEVIEVLSQTKSLIQSYLAGLLIEAGLVATLNTAGLLLLGIDYALLIGVIGALLNVIPYIGGIVAIALPMIIALATKEPVYAIYVFGVYMLVQFIDNNFIVPRIVASKVKINALVSIVVVLIGGALWGVPGMFLSLPLTAILKVIFDHITPLKPLGFLLGDTMPAMTIFKFKYKKIIHSKTK